MHPLKKMAFRLVVIQLITTTLTILIGEWMGLFVLIGIFPGLIYCAAWMAPVGMAGSWLAAVARSQARWKPLGVLDPHPAPDSQRPDRLAGTSQTF